MCETFDQHCKAGIYVLPIMWFWLSITDINTDFIEFSYIVGVGEFNPGGTLNALKHVTLYGVNISTSLETNGGTVFVERSTPVLFNKPSQLAKGMIRLSRPSLSQ